MTTSGQQLLMAVKNGAGIQDKKFTLMVHGFEGYSLRPIVTKSRDLQSIRDISCLTNNRNRFVTAFLTEFMATEQRTAAWLCDAVHSDNSRVLFMIDNPQLEPVGYMGLAYIDWTEEYGEADAIVKGDSETPKGLMSCALLTLLQWAECQLGLKTIGVRVLSDNPALQFYRRLGFKEIKRVPLRKLKSPDFVNWVEDASISYPERYLVHHIWTLAK